MQGYRFDWTVVWQYRQALAQALALSLELAAASLLIGLVLGLGFAWLSQSRRRSLRGLAHAYVATARSTPLLLLVFLVYLVLPQYGLRGLTANQTFVAALSVTAGGYLCENFRSAFASMPRAYLDSARAIGLTAWQRQVHVVLPIALRYALPSLTNSAVSVFKDTSIASMISVRELTFTAREISTNFFRVFEAWFVVAGLYLAVSTLMALLARRLERRMPRLS